MEEKIRRVGEEEEKDEKEEEDITLLHNSLQTA